MKFTNVHIRKARRRTLIYFCIGIIFLVAAIGVYVHGYIIVKNKKANEKKLIDAPPVAHIVANVEVKDNPPMQFASDDDVGYYFVSDGSYYYVVSFKESKYDEIVDEFNKNNGNITLRGYTKYFENDLAQIAINTINSTYGEQILNQDNYTDMLGHVILHVDNKLTFAYANLALGHLLIVIAAAIISVYFLFVGIIGLWKKDWINVSPYISDADLDRELNSINSRWYDTTGMYETEYFLVDISIMGVRVFRYADIMQAYQARHSTNGAVDRIYMVIILNNGNIYNVADKKANEAATEEINMLLAVIEEKNPSVTIGY